MAIYLNAHDVFLELETQFQRVADADDPAGILATVGGTEKRLLPVLRNINFSALPGDRIGLVGLNGAGKSTLLRVLNGAFPPTRGVIECNGSVQSLLNSTLGFMDAASVTENVFLRGTAMGLRRAQLKAALPGILKFAGLTDRSNYRLHTLSAGQRTRLGFAISTAVQPDILLMDEWIATGDAVFIKKAQDRISRRFHGSQIVVLASHSSGLLRSICNKALVLDAGRMVFFGHIDEGLERYRSLVAAADETQRAQAVASDPLLFGATTGMVERIHSSQHLVRVEGWAVTEKGREVGVVGVEIDGQRWVFEHFDRVDRADVRHHLGKRSGHYGFRVQVETPPVLSRGNVLARINVMTGAGPEDLRVPLPVAPAAIVEQE